MINLPSFNLRRKDGPRPSAGGLYIHVPFCRRKCIYCDFYSAGGRIADWNGYVKAVLAELKAREAELPQPLQTVYIGGGTPSLMPLEQFSLLTESLRPYVGHISEFTIEVNPEDVNEENLRAWKNAGVNRLSIGVQTFHDDLLKKIGRGHDAEKARVAFRQARRHFSNISIDLMFGLPGQTLEKWREDVNEAVEMRPEHISAYSLMYEPGTALTLLRDQGRVAEAEEGLSEVMYAFLVKELKEAGYEHYELSNFALPGYRSRHNSSYWTQTPYLGLGPGAHSYDGIRTRTANHPDLRAYLDQWREGRIFSENARMKGRIFNENACKEGRIFNENACKEGRIFSENAYDKEHLSEEELREEYVMTRLRTCEGIPMNDFIARFGEGEWTILQRKAARWLESGALIFNGSHLHLSETAVLTSDSVIVDII